MTILYKVFENGSLSFGRSCCCDFCFPDNDLLSSRHVVIEKGMIETEITMSGKNGGFIKNRFVGKNEKCWITYGDEIRLPGIDIMWLFPYIAVKSSTKYETKAYQINETEVTESRLGFVKYDAEGVGLATTASVVLSIILIFIANYFLSIVIYI